MCFFFRYALILRKRDWYPLALSHHLYICPTPNNFTLPLQTILPFPPHIFPHDSPFSNGRSARSPLSTSK